MDKKLETYLFFTSNGQVFGRSDAIRKIKAELFDL